MNPDRDYSKDPILKKISNTQQQLKKYLERVEKLESKLHSRDLSSDERSRLYDELRDVKKLLLNEEHNLKYFYGENSKTFFLAVSLMFFSFLIYGVYLMIYGPQNSL